MHYLIIANGSFLADELILRAAINRRIVALDGACEKLLKVGIKPDIILGDFDSISEAQKHYWGIKKGFDELQDEEAPYLGYEGCLIVPAKNQRLTDLKKAIRYCDNDARSIDIVCAFGVRTDHTLGNLRALRTEHKPDRALKIHTDTETIQFVKDSEISIEGKIGEYCGVLAFPAASFTSKGLKYNGDHSSLIFGFQDSTCNQLADETALIHIEGEALIIGPQKIKSI